MGAVSSHSALWNFSNSILFQELEDPLILIHEKKISSMSSTVKVLELALKVSGCFQGGFK